MASQAGQDPAEPGRHDGQDNIFNLGNPTAPWEANDLDGWHDSGRIFLDRPPRVKWMLSQVEAAFLSVSNSSLAHRAVRSRFIDSY